MSSKRYLPLPDQATPEIIRSTNLDRIAGLSITVPATALGAVSYLLPTILPFLSPVERALTHNADLAWQISFFHELIEPQPGKDRKKKALTEVSALGYCLIRFQTKPNGSVLNTIWIIRPTVDPACALVKSTAIVGWRKELVVIASQSFGQIKYRHSTVQDW